MAKVKPTSDTNERKQTNYLGTRHALMEEKKLNQ